MTACLGYLGAFGLRATWSRPLALFVVVLVACAAPVGLRHPEGPISIAQWEAAREWVMSRRAVECRDRTATDFECESPAHKEQWNFTRVGHPAHPAVSTSKMIWYQTSKGRAIRIDRLGHYAGDKSAFDVWTRSLVGGDADTLRTLDELALAK